MKFDHKLALYTAMALCGGLLGIPEIPKLPHDLIGAALTTLVALKAYLSVPPGKVTENAADGATLTK